MEAKLQQQVCEGNLENVMKIIKLGADVNKVSASNGYLSLLDLACHYDHYDIAVLLINNGANINQKIKFKNDTPLITAIHHHKFKFVELFLANGADISGVIGHHALRMSYTRPSSFGLSSESLKAAVEEKEKIFKYLIQNNIDVNYCDTEVEPIFFELCENSVWYLNKFKYVMENGADIYLKNHAGQNILEYLDAMDKNTFLTGYKEHLLALHEKKCLSEKIMNDTHDNSHLITF